MHSTYTKLVRDITAICQHRNFECSEIGRVGKNKQYPLLRVVIEPPEYTKTLLVIAGVHAGTEPAPVMAAVEFLREYEVQPVKIILFPCLNPSSVRMGSRKNWEGKDLNRSRHGYFQPEQTLCLLHSYGQKIDAVISLHEDNWLSGQCYGFGFNQNRKHKNFYAGLLQAMNQHMPVLQKDTLDGLSVEEGIIWDRYDTSLEARFAEAGVPLCFCSETGRGNFQQRVRANVALLKQATESLM
ncbi:hypothetical protein COU78_04985 [Candidatus Peregrinibacteria bacterium CG10_big_fil_rev_8_21_14_0_10_49_24]|nr:MAG: hypothetical protein COU78_04985 [Candidatus Peregrinibacteria bacterium CG10_big_fil_rev_8_21_14_0_10_49_24]